MKQVALYGLLAIALFGCQRDPNRTPVKQVFVHKYGVEVDQHDWEERGRDGQVVTTRKDGVVARQTYDHGRLHGQSTLTFPHSSTLASLEEYEEGRLTRTQENYRSGNPAKEVVYKLGNEQITTCWYEDGTPQSIEVMRGGFLASAEYFDANHALTAQVRNGEGKRIVRDGNRIQAEDTILAGQMTKRITYHTSGEPESITPYVDGRIHGERLTFHEGGLPNTVEPWVNGQLHGTVIAFADGQKLSETPYTNGAREGIECIYGANGELQEQITWVGDQRHGPTRFLADGEEKTTDWYFEGKNVRQSTFDRLTAQYSPA